VIDNPNPNPIFKMDCQSNPNPTIPAKRYRTAMAKFYDETMEFPRDIPYQLIPY